MPRLKGVSFETAIIKRYRRRESSVEEALIEMYLAGVSVRRVEDITEALWGSKVSPSTISEDGIEETLTYCDFPKRALDAHPHKQRDRAAEPRDPPQDSRGGDIPRRELCSDAGLCEAASCGGNSVGQ